MVRLWCPRIFCSARMLPPFIMKWLANVWRNKWVDCPSCSTKPAASTASRNAHSCVAWGKYLSPLPCSLWCACKLSFKSSCTRTVRFFFDVKFRAIVYPFAAGHSFGREPYCKLSLPRLNRNHSHEPNPPFSEHNTAHPHRDQVLNRCNIETG
jgi:hypothetical protein